VTGARAAWPPPVRRVRRYRNVVISAACNLSCSYCDDKRARVDIPATIGALDAIFARHEPNSVLFRVEADGEITLYPALLDRLQAAAAAGYPIEVLSNGTRLPGCLAGRPDLLWVFSVDGHTAAMNAKRGLTQAQVDAILDAAIAHRAELQCVFHDQTVDEMNGFIDLLAARGYGGLLHIMPLLAFKGRPLEVYLDRRQLHDAPFLAPDEYFARWKYIYEHGHRGPYVCDQIRNGYNYEISGGRTRMVKCDCYSVPSNLYHDLGPEQEVDAFPCGTCIANQELNNSRPRMQMPRRLPVVGAGPT
jgi:MoaA/NifB/PqqE/SkfB family radical SAM enzyme